MGRHADVDEIDRRCVDEEILMRDFGKRESARSPKHKYPEKPPDIQPFPAPLQSQPKFPADSCESKKSITVAHP